ncbi:putative bifunctional diguanylate cyclase/phosphodiesterase [Pseudidiomarina sp.]|uniref:putative bifunctional diguanylate cyclase/phosphodiesterase n=1 Tax=Pseudidiomarina sp. TaxID=2081707 RepID=UPI003A987B11
MRIIQVDQQAKAVVNLVLGAALFIAAFVILLYRLFEPTQLQVYHSLSSSLLIAACANGIALLTYDLNSQREWKPGVSRVFAVLAIIASADGLVGNLFDSFDAQIHPSLYITSGLAGLWMSLRLRSHWAIRAQRIIAGVAALALAVVLLMHFVIETPLLARHPSGSLVAGALVLITLIALWNLSTASEQELPCVSMLTTTIALVGLLVSTTIGVVLFHNEMNELRDRGEEAAVNLNIARRAAGNEHVSTLKRLAERWENYPDSIHNSLMELDMNAFLRDVDFLESIILRRGTELMWERSRDRDTSYKEMYQNDAYVQQQFDPLRKEHVQMLVASRSKTEDGARVYIHIPIDFKDDNYEKGYWGILAVMNVPQMLSNQTLTYRSPIYTYTAISNGMLLDQHGHWVTTPTLDYLHNHALFLYESSLETEFTTGTPIYSYMYDLQEMQARANLQILVTLAGIAIVLFMALTIERNRELVVQGRQLRFQAEHDALTGLYNRTTIEHMIADRFHKQRDLTAMFIDLDGFTLINDSLGLQVGDRLLQVLAQRLTNIIGKRGMLARFGGDEFLIVMQKMQDDEEGLAEITSKILSAVAQPYRIMHHKIYLTASIGVAHQTEDQYAPLELIQRADMAMHQAKRQGHNHVQIYQDSMSLQFKSSAAMRSSLQEAIEKNQLTLHYQPIVRCNDGATVGYEALLRWEREPGRFISPTEFIPLAEMTGQIIPLSEWVFRRACEAAVTLQKHGPCKVAVNLSTLHFNRSEFTPFLEQTLEETGCNPEWLELELTESILMENTDYAVEVLQNLRDKKISISLDDFGTGFSSLSYLKRLPVDKVKIDRSFIAGIRTHRSDRVLIGSVIKIAQSLNFAVVAEGVETAQQAEFVTELGCNYMQGFYFGRAVPLGEL